MDLSAFYNIDTETAFNKIRSGMAGMVRPLRDLGIDLTAATLEEFRLAQGIETSYSQMSQAEKVMLRYQYLMANTKTQQGDFGRTSLSLANSLRTLQAYAQAVGTQIGVGLSSAIRHVVVWLNTMMKYTLKAATAFANFMQTIFGKYKGGASGIAMEGLGDAADYAEDLGGAADNAASGLGDAADSAQQLKKDLSVLPFDELNQLNKDREATSSGSGTSGAGSGGIGSGSLTDGLLDWNDLTESAYEGSALKAAINAWATQLKKDFLMHDWEGLGKDLAGGLNRGLQKVYDLLDPEEFKKKVDPWIHAVTTTFNSFVDNFDFDLLGRTFGRGINNFVHVANETIEGIDWRNLGSKLAAGANGIMEEVDFREVGNLIGNKFMVFWNTLNGFVHDFHWDELGTSIANTINGLNEKLDLSVVADTLATGTNGVFTALGTLADETHWNEIATNIANGIVTFIDTMEWEKNAENLKNFITKLCDAITKAVDDVGPEKWEELGQGIADMLAAVPWEKVLKTVGHAIVTALVPILKGILSEPEGKVAAAIVAGIGLIRFNHSAFGQFAGHLVEALTGETVGTLLKSSMKKFLKKQVTDAANEATLGEASKGVGKSVAKGAEEGALSSGLFGNSFWSKLFQTGAIIGLVRDARNESKRLVGVAEDFATVRDYAQNANLSVEELGNIITAMGDKSTAAGIVTKAAVEGARDDMAKAMEDGRISESEAETILSNLCTQLGMTGDEFATIADSARNTEAGVNTAVDGMGTGFAGLNSTIANYVQGAAKDLLKNKLDFEGVETSAKNAEAAIGNSFKNAGQRISEYQSLASSQMRLAQAAVSGFSIGANSDLEKNTSGFKGWQGAAVGFMATTMGKMGNVLTQSKDMSSGVSNDSSSMITAVQKSRSEIESAVEMLKKKFAESMGGLSSTAATAMNEVASIMMQQVGQFGLIGQEMGQALANGFASIRVPIPHMYVAAWQQVNFGDGGYMFYPEFGLQWYRKGGLFQGGDGQMIGIAEDGRDEAVLPLEDRRAMQRIGSAIADAGGSYENDLMIDKLADRLADIIMMRQDNEQAPIFNIEVKTENDEVLARAVERGQQRLDYRNNPTPKMAY